MTVPPRRASAAGARRAPAAFLLAALALGRPVPAAAHGPEVQRSRTPFPPGAAEPVPTPPLAPAPAVPNAGVSAASGARPLRTLATGAAAVVLGDVVRIESYDEDRLRVYRIRVVRVLRGRLDEPEPALVEMRGSSQRPPLLADGERVVLLLERAPRITYLVQHLPEAALYAPVGGRDGVVRVGSETEVEGVERALAEGAAVANLDGVDQPQAIRRLAFTELASPSPRLAADALVELRGLPGLSPLGRDEVGALAAALRSPHLDATTRVGLIELVADRGAREALPAVSGATADTPAVLAAVLAARARLGAPAGRPELAAWLGGQDAAVRAAAVRALGRLDDPAALAEVGRYATADADSTVRVAAIEALGASQRPEAAPLLARTFDSTEREIQQRSGQALLALGGPAAEEALVDLALRGRTPETQKYATLLLIVSRGREHPAVKRIEAAGPSPDVRDLLEHGLEFLDSHKH